MSRTRLAALRNRMKDLGLDAMVVARPENRAYLTGFTGSAGWVLVTQAKACLVVDFRYTEQAEAQAPAFEVVLSTTSGPAVLADLLMKQEGRNLGFEGDFLTFDEYGLYREHFGFRELVAASGLVESLRIVKDEEERGRMAQAAAIADQAFTHILGVIRPGLREWEVAVELEHKMRQLGAFGASFETIIASGVRSSLPHGIASQKVIEAGELVTLDFGAIYEGYCSDMTRTVMVGEPDEQQRQIYAIVLEAQQRGVAACRAGLSGKQLDEVCRNCIADYGYGNSFGHGTGHGVGRQIHEGPRVSFRGEKEILRPGMVVTIEPGVYLPGWGGVRIEDMVLVTESGCESFSKSPKDLIIL